MTDAVLLRPQFLSELIDSGVSAFRLPLPRIDEDSCRGEWAGADEMFKFRERLFRAGTALTGERRDGLVLQGGLIIPYERAQRRCEIGSPHGEAEYDPLIRRQIRIILFELRALCHDGALSAPEELGEAFVFIRFLRDQAQHVGVQLFCHALGNILRVALQ